MKKSTLLIWLCLAIVFAGCGATGSDANKIKIYSVVQRVYPPKHKQWSYCAKFLTFAVENSGMYTIKFSVNWPDQSSGETGMIIDKFELVPMDDASPAMKKWYE